MTVSIHHISELKDDADLVRRCARTAFWDILFHESNLSRCHKNVAIAQVMLERLNLPADRKKALEMYEEDIEAFSHADQLAIYTLGAQVGDLQYHEDGLAEGHQFLGLVKMLIHRGNYKLDLNEIEAEVKRDREEKRGI